MLSNKESRSNLLNYKTNNDLSEECQCYLLLGDFFGRFISLGEQKYTKYLAILCLSFSIFLVY